jgi:hypothetical protein
MSIEKVQRASGTVWRVRWRDPQGRTRSRVVGRQHDAQALDAEIKRARRLGGIALVANSRETLADFAKVWWQRHAAPNLQRHTLAGYASMLDVHIIPRLGNVRLQAITPELVADLRADMAAAGIGDPAIRKTLTLLQSILERAVEWRHWTPTPPVGSVSQASAARGSCAPFRLRRSRRSAPTSSARIACSTPRSCPRLRGPAPGRGDRTALARRRRADPARRALHRLRPAQGHQDGPRTHSAAPRPARRGPHLVAREDLTTRPHRPHLPGAGWLPMERRPRPQLAQAHVRRGRRRRRRAQRSPLRPAPQFRQPADRPGRNRRRRGQPGRARADDDARHLRPPVQRPRRRRAHLSSGSGPPRPRPNHVPGCVRFVSAWR